MTRYVGKTSAQKIEHFKRRYKNIYYELQRCKESKDISIGRANYRASEAGKKATKVKRQAKSKIREIEESVAHIVKDEVFDDTSKLKHIEIITRTIIAYRKLESEGIMSFSELAFLLIGSQLEYFSLKQFDGRFGKVRTKVRDINLLIEAGFFQKVERKPYYYITVLGKDRLNSILNYIYGQKSNFKVLRTGK